ncbi:hypothetical protein ABG067_007923, partial [Albugo candida]
MNSYDQYENTSEDYDLYAATRTVKPPVVATTIDPYATTLKAKKTNAINKTTPVASKAKEIPNT